MSQCINTIIASIHVDRWVEFGSEEWRMLDETPDFTKKIIKFGFEDGWLYADKMGRIYGRDLKNSSKPHYPLHFNVGNKIYGYRISTKAAN